MLHCHARIQVFCGDIDQAEPPTNTITFINPLTPQTLEAALEIKDLSRASRMKWVVPFLLE